MTVRIYGYRFRHRVARLDADDRRLALTRCGIRFAWGYVPSEGYRRPDCERCFA